MKKVLLRETNIYKGVSVKYNAEYFYCEKADEMYADEQQMTSNDSAMKNAYRMAAAC
ncbi:MAG: hypothetical protein IJ083_05855 [Clostridia bacterium]|nr:hypothetical protein [Clostridia bacterium]